MHEQFVAMHSHTNTKLLEVNKTRAVSFSFLLGIPLAETNSKKKEVQIPMQIMPRRNCDTAGVDFSVFRLNRVPASTKPTFCLNTRDGFSFFVVRSFHLFELMEVLHVCEQPS